jgi:hypothetical protein
VTTDPQAAVDRRSFLRSAARASISAGLVGSCGLLVLRKSGGNCAKPIVCGECGKFSGCDLPKAQTARAQQGTGEVDA